MNETLFPQAIELIKAGRKKEAGALLQAVLRADKTNEMAWLWLAECAETTEERVQALELCVRLNPKADLARQGLAKLLREKEAEQARLAGAAAPGPAVFTPAALSEPAVFIFTDEKDGRAAPNEGVAQGAGKGSNKETSPKDAGQPASLPPAETDWTLTSASSIFTVRPDSISAEEFSRIEETTADFLINHRDLSLATRLEDSWAEVQLKPNGTRPLRAKKRENGSGSSASLFHW
jgi:hypothetical protein